MRYNESKNEVRRENRMYVKRQDFQQRCVNTEDSPCGYCVLVGRLIEFVEHCSFLDFRVDDRYYFPYSITRFRLLTLFGCCG